MTPFDELLEQQAEAQTSADKLREEALQPRPKGDCRHATLWLAAETRCARIEAAVRAEEERMRQ